MSEMTQTATAKTVLELRGMTIDIRSDECLYITIGDKTFYVDDSTDEAIMDWWPKEEMTLAEKLEEGICVECGGDDVMCEKDCALHVCVDCNYAQEKSNEKD